MVTASNAGDALNFGRAEHMGREDRYARAQEFYEVVAALWDSWADDAFPQDKATGQYLDPARVRPIDHRGTYFTVQQALRYLSDGASIIRVEPWRGRPPVQVGAPACRT